MKYIFCFLAIVLAAQCGDGLETIEVKNDAGVVVEKYTRNKSDFAKQGIYTGYDSQGNIIEAASYSNDTLNGQRTIYYANGKKEAFETYKMGDFHGPYKTYYESGRINLEGSYTDGKMEGEWKRYYDQEDEQLMETVTFADNNENGPFVEYHANGNLKAKGSYLGGDKEHGLLELFDENGELERKMNCEKGICKTIWQKEEN